jgi:hypothetical protein
MGPAPAMANNWVGPWAKRPASEDDLRHPSGLARSVDFRSGMISGLPWVRSVDFRCWVMPGCRWSSVGVFDAGMMPGAAGFGQSIFDAGVMPGCRWVRSVDFRCWDDRRVAAGFGRSIFADCHGFGGCGPDPAAPLQVKPFTAKSAKRRSSRFPPLPPVRQVKRSQATKGRRRPPVCLSLREPFTCRTRRQGQDATRPSHSLELLHRRTRRRGSGRDTPPHSLRTPSPAARGGGGPPSPKSDGQNFDAGVIAGLPLGSVGQARR